MCKPVRAALISLASILWGLTAQAQEHCGPNQAECVAVGTWEIQLAVGAGVRSNPLAEGDDVPLILIPQVSYYGKRVFLDNLELGFTLVDEPKWMLNALITPGRDGLYFFRDDWGRFALDGGLNVGSSNAPPLEFDQPTDSADSPSEQPAGRPQVNSPEQAPGDNANESPSPAEPMNTPGEPDLSKRRIAGMAGLEASARMGVFEWQLQALTDVTGVHNGEELRLALSTGTQAQAHKLGLALGLSWKSAEVMEYYYGVTHGEASARRPAYRPDSGASPFVRLTWSRPVSQTWRWLGSVQLEHLSSAVRDSPLVNEDQVLQVFVGGVYHF